MNKEVIGTILEGNKFQEHNLLRNERLFLTIKTGEEE